MHGSTLSAITVIKLEMCPWDTDALACCQLEFSHTFLLGLLKKLE